MYAVSPRIIEKCAAMGCTVSVVDLPSGVLQIHVIHVCSNIGMAVEVSPALLRSLRPEDAQQTIDINVLNALPKISGRVFKDNFPYVQTPNSLNNQELQYYSATMYRELLRQTRAAVNKDPWWYDSYQVDKVIKAYLKQDPSFSVVVERGDNYVDITVSVVAYKEPRIAQQQLAQPLDDLSTGSVIVAIIKMVDGLNRQFFGI